MTKKKTNWGLVGAIVGVCAAPFTGGTSLGITVACGGLGFAGGKIAESTGLLDNGSDDSLNNNLEAWKIQNDQWKVMIEANRAEVERLRKEREENDKKVNHNNNEVERLRSIINNPHSTDEEKNNAKKRIVLLEDEVRQLKNKNKKIDEDITNKSNTPSAPTKPWTLPKLSLVDKALIAGGVVLLVYLLIPSEKKK